MSAAASPGGAPVSVLPIEAARDVTYVELAPGLIGSPLEPLFIGGAVPAELDQFYAAQQQVLPVGCFMLRDVGVTLHGLIAWQDHILASSQLNANASSIAEVGLYGPVGANASPSPRVEGRAVLLTGPGHLIYGHWLVDFLPKIFVLRHLGIDFREAPLVLPSDTPEFALAWLSFLGVPDDNMLRFDPRAGLLPVEELVVPTLLRTASRVHPMFREAAAFLAESLPEALRQTPIRPEFERVFLSRKQSGRLQRQLVNRDEIEHIAEAAGYRIVHPETLPLADQVSILRSARRIAGEYGSALHGSIFSAPGSAVYAVRATSFHPGYLQSGLCQVLDQNVAYMYGPAGLGDINQRFFADPELFARGLAVMDDVSAGPGAPLHD